MSPSQPGEEDLFNAARRIAAQAARAAFLREATVGDEALLRRVEDLLAAHDAPDRLLDGPVAVGSTTRPFSPAEDRTAGEAAGTVIAGRYKLLELIGEGGMGEVWMALQTEPVKRAVAVKLIRPGMDSRQVVARFDAERQALALMDHANIAKVLDGGTTADGRPYFVMELVKGVPITRFCDDRNLTPRERLELFVPVCQAIQHAHQKGVIHRDIKPSNVLVALYDDRPVPKVIDFGVAKAVNQPLTGLTLHTGYGSIIGTLEYMSPEQAGFNQLDVDTRTDIYSLGVLLYELLAGSTPLEHGWVKQATYSEILRRIAEEEPPRPSCRLGDSGEALASISANRQTEPAKLTRLVRGELDWIVMKCLEKDRGRRYETVNEFTGDIQRYLVDEPVQACPPTAAYRFRKFARRNRRAMATAAVLAVGGVLTIAGLAASALLIEREKRATEDALRAETAAKNEADRNLEKERQEAYFHRISLAHRELSTDNLGRAQALLDACPADLRGWEWHYLMRACRVEPVMLPIRLEVNALAFSPDGGRIACGGGGAVTIWEVQAGAVGRVIERAHDGYVSSVAFHPNGNHLATVGEDKRVRVWDLTTGREVFSRPCDSTHIHGASHAVAFHPPDGRQLAVAHGGRAELWDWAADPPAPLHTFLVGSERRPINLAFSGDGRRLATGTWRGRVQVWDVPAGDLPLTFPVSRDAHHPVSAVAFSGDGGRLTSASFNSRVDVWDGAGELLRSLPHSGLVLCTAFSPDGLRIATCGMDKTVRVWEAATDREVLALRGHTGACTCLAFSPDGLRIASASKDGFVRLWDATPLPGGKGQETDTFRPHPAEVWSVAVSPDGRQVVSGGLDSPPAVWDADTGKVRHTLAGHRDVVFCVAWDPDGKRVATGGADGGLFSVMVWDAETGAKMFTLPPGNEYFSVAFSRDGKHLVTGRLNENVQVWDARTGALLHTLGTRKGAIRGVACSTDGKHLASVGGDGVVELWDATNLTGEQQPRRRLPARLHGPCRNIGFSPDGRWLATGGKENTVKLWDVETGVELHTLRGHSGDICSVAFSPDGRWLASAGEDSAVKVWDTRTWEPVHSLRGHTSIVYSLAFRPESSVLLSGSRDSKVLVWDLSRMKNPTDRE